MFDQEKLTNAALVTASLIERKGIRGSFGSRAIWGVLASCTRVNPFVGLKGLLGNVSLWDDGLFVVGAR